MTIFSSFSANFPPHYHTILAINCVHASNWFTHLQQTQQTDGQSDNSVLTVHGVSLLVCHCLLPYLYIWFSLSWFCTLYRHDILCLDVTACFLSLASVGILWLALSPLYFL